MAQPFVTVAVPCLDEEEHIESFLQAVDVQDWPRDRLEILVADGMSLDATREILMRHAAVDPRIQLIDNPGRLAAAGLNECIRRAKGDVIVRMDVRASYASDFVTRCVEALDKSGADNAGGAARLEGGTFFERCVAAALRSPLGAGGGKHNAPREDGFVDTVWLGAFRRSVFERVGLFDPRAVASEDAELDQRIVDAGGRVFISRDIVAHYRPRGTLRALAKQYFEHGRGRARTLLKHRRLASFKSIKPALPFFGLLGEVVLLVTAPLPAGGISLAAYALATGAEAVRVGRSEGIAAIPVVWALFPVLHVSHGVGFAAGLVKYVLRPDWGALERLSSQGAAAAATAV